MALGLTVIGGLYTTARLTRDARLTAARSGPRPRGDGGDPPQPRVDPPLSAAFAKDPADERFIAQLNAALAPLETPAPRPARAVPTLHIVGAPRSAPPCCTR